MNVDADLLVRRAAAAKRRSRITRIGVVTLGVGLLGFLGLLLTPIVGSIRSARRESMLAKLPYPPLSESPEGLPLQGEHFLGGVRVWTSYLPVQPATGASTAPDRWLQAMVWFEGSVRQKPSDHVYLEVLIHPVAPSRPPKRILSVVIGDDSHEYLASRSEIKNSGTSSNGGQYESIDFDIPTEDFMSLVGHSTAYASMDGSDFEITEENIKALRAFAAFLKPGIALPTSSSP